jgi:hypothetical protein
MIKLLNNHISALAFLFIGVFYMLWCIDFGNLQFGDIGDSRFNNWVLEYFYTALSKQSPSFKTSNFFYPLINNILLSDNHWLMGIFYSFFRFLDFDSYSSYSIILILESILNFISCYYVLRKFNLSKNSSAIGAFIFSFNTIIAIKISHSQLHFKAFIPLAILFVFQYFEKRDFKYIALTLFSVAMQLMASSYNGMFLIIFLIIIILTILSNYKFTDFKNPLEIDSKFQRIWQCMLLVSVDFVFGFRISFQFKFRHHDICRTGLDRFTYFHFNYFLHLDTWRKNLSQFRE